jgi:subtilase family serine protease
MKARLALLRVIPVLALVGAPTLTAANTIASARTSPEQFRQVCAATVPGEARCFALLAASEQSAGSSLGSIPAGYGATDLESAYRLPLTRGSGQTIAIVDAFDDPTAAQDVSVYRKTFGLPPCTSASGCFRKLNQQGQANHYPAYDPSWSIEMSLDLDMMSAACPLCHIVLVEANSALIQDLAASENTAAALGVAAVSNSYGLQEFNGMQPLAKFYTHRGTTVVASSGDTGFSIASFPAVLANVVSVGGTELSPSTSRRGWSETAWSFGSSGCSAYVNKPSWQDDNHCFMRTVADMSAVADNITAYDSNLPSGFEGLQPGFIVVAGTSASAPFIAGVIGLAGNGHTFTAAFPYQHRSGFFDVRAGSNGFCGGDYLCNAVRGYDAPTGLGTPNGIAGL